MIETLLGKLLRGRHAGVEKLVWNHPSVAEVPSSIQLWSPAFPNDGVIPLRYTAATSGENCSPPLRWSNIPEGTAEIVLIMEDPDAPILKPAVHLIAIHLSPLLAGVEEGVLNRTADDITLGRGTFGKVGYSGPRALRAHGPHRYVFQIFAVSTSLAFSKPPSLSMLRKAWSGKVIARGRLDGFFEQK
jgi:Raf kinase inhibitor-like YbhB/YbcL family protein